MGDNNSLPFPISSTGVCKTTKIIFLYELKKLEQRGHKCMELKGGICRIKTFLLSIS
jgi:hypothetical protein